MKRSTNFKTALSPKTESSIFDAVIKTEGSVFDSIVQETSLFDDLVDKNVDETAANWDDRVARTLTLAENLVEIRNSVKRK